MSKATETPTTPPPAMPSVYRLGLCLASVNAEYEQLEASEGNHDKALTLLERREETLFELISTLPAMSIADAAVQIRVACIYADVLAACEWGKPDAQARLDRSHEALNRIVLSALPHIAAAAGLDMDAMGWSAAARLRAAQFCGSEYVS